MLQFTIFYSAVRDTGRQGTLILSRSVQIWNFM